MSNALAIAAVTAVLRDLLNNGLIDANVSGITAGNVEVTVLPPDQVIGEENGSAPSGLNLFLYQVTPNLGWRNQGLPAYNSRGEPINSNPLALDLHYLLTAYSAEDFYAEILLGYGMQLLHETPVLSRAAIRRTLSTPLPSTILPPAFQALSGADLAEQVELIKITPQSLGTEELFRLWSAFQTRYRPTVAYQVSVVLIERARPAPSALPVKEEGVNLYVAPFQQPVIEQVMAAGGKNAAIVADSTLIIQGQHLRGEATRVRMGQAEFTPERIHPSQLELSLWPPGAPTSRVQRAGVHSLQVVHELNLGSPPVPHGGVESNVAAFVLRPTIVPAIATVNCSTAEGVTTCSAEITLQFTPRVGRRQRVFLLLNQLQPAAGATAQAYRFRAPAENGIAGITADDTNSIPFAVAGVAPGTYLVRAQVDGAESPLELDADPTSLTSNQYTSPAIVVPPP